MLEEHGLNAQQGFGGAIYRGLTVYHSMSIACALASSEATTVRFFLSPAPGGLWFCRKQMLRNPDLGPGLEQLERYSLSLLVDIVRLGAGRDWRPEKACLVARQPTLKPDWDAFADTSFVFETSCSAIFVPKRILSLPIQKDADLARSGFDGRYSGGCERPRGLCAQLRALLPVMVEQKSATIETMAEIAACSPRTLQRRLGDEGCSFRELVSEVRLKMAVELLKDPCICISDISDHLGYEHPAHFVRAFRGWTGLTPGNYRHSRRQ